MYGNVPIIEQAAREIIERHGSDAVPIIRERAENATDLADEIAAKEWRDIADAAERILREPQNRQQTVPLQAKDNSNARRRSPL